MVNIAKHGKYCSTKQICWFNLKQNSYLYSVILIVEIFKSLGLAAIWWIYVMGRIICRRH